MWNNIEKGNDDLGKTMEKIQVFAWICLTNKRNVTVSLI